MRRWWYHYIDKEGHQERKRNRDNGLGDTGRDIAVAISEEFANVREKMDCLTQGQVC